MQNGSSNHKGKEKDLGDDEEEEDEDGDAVYMDLSEVLAAGQSTNRTSKATRKT